MQNESIQETPPSYKLTTQTSFLEYLAQQEQTTVDNDFIVANWIKNNRAEKFDKLMDDFDFIDMIDCFVASDTKEMKNTCFTKALNMIDDSSLPEFPTEEAA